MNRPMEGVMESADFQADTITLKMRSGYYARAGTYVLVPLEEYEHLVNNQKSPMDEFQEMTRRP